MATSMVPSSAFLSQLKAERNTAFETAEKAEHRARMLDELIGEYEAGRAQGQKSATAGRVHQMARSQVTTPKKGSQRLTTAKPTAKTAAPAKKATSMKTSSSVKHGKRTKIQKGQSTMEIARQVLSNAGTELRVEEVRRGMKDDFGHTPAASLDQMLYKRSKAESDFYAVKDQDGRNRYGLIAWRQTGNSQRAA